METITKTIEKYWPSKTIGFVVLPLVVTVSSFSMLAAVTPEKYFPFVVVASSMLGGCSLVIWSLANRVAKHQKGTVGFDLVLAHENEEQGKRIRADFCARLRDLLLAPGSESNFSFIEHPQRVCRQYLDESSIPRLCDRTNSCFVLFGRTKLRQVEGREQHVLELAGGVRHAPIKAEISKKIATEMRDALGSDVVIAQENDLFSFRITASRIEVATKYIVSIAALVSGDLNYAELLLKELEERLAKNDHGTSPELARIKNRIPIRLGEVGIIKCRRLGDRFVFGEDRDALSALDKELQRFKRYIVGWYSGYLLGAICHFELRRDVQGAIKLISECRVFPDTTWCYSMAFLSAYEGDLQQAWRYYQQAFRRPPADPSIPNQCDSFIHSVLSSEPDKVQLWYCLGLINLKAKNDLAGARRDFSAFLARSRSGEFEPQRKIATRYICKIDRELSGHNNIVPFDDLAA